MSKNTVLSSVDLLIERIVLFFRLLGVGPAAVGSAQPVQSEPEPRRGGLDAGELCSKILVYLEHAGKPVRKTDILHHIGKQAKLADINEALTVLVEQGKIVGATVSRGQGRPAEMWDLVWSRRTKPVDVIRTTGKHAKVVASVKKDIARRDARARQAKAKVARVAREDRAKIARVVKATIAKGVATTPVKAMTVPELGEKVWSFMRRNRRPMNRQVISGHLGHKVPARRINACLAHLKRKGRATDRVVTNGSGRPAVLWVVKL